MSLEVQWARVGMHVHVCVCMYVCVCVCMCVWVRYCGILSSTIAAECYACNILFPRRVYLRKVPWKVIALLFIQVVEDTEKYKEKSHHPESHHPEANFGKFSYCNNS